MGKKREFDEPFKILDLSQKEEIIKEISKLNLRYIKGARYFHLIGLSDKGQAVVLLSDLLRQEFGSIQTIGIGDSENDFPMLDHVEHSFLVKQKIPTGRYVLICQSCAFKLRTLPKDLLNVVLLRFFNRKRPFRRYKLLLRELVKFICFSFMPKPNK